MKWFRYRFRQSYGLGNWVYVFVHDEIDETNFSFEDYLDSNIGLPHYSIYQGVDWEIVETVPEIVLENQKQNILRKIEELQKELSLVESTKIRECPSGRYWLIKDKKGNIEDRFGFFYEIELEEGCEYLSVTKELFRQFIFSNKKQKRTIFFWEQKIQQEQEG